MSGMRAPKKPAITRFRTIEMPSTRPSSGLWLTPAAMAATRRPLIAPFAAPATTGMYTARSV
jgi:hypothetical protein